MYDEDWGLCYKTPGGLHHRGGHGGKHNIYVNEGNNMIFDYMLIEI